MLSLPSRLAAAQEGRQAVEQRSERVGLALEPRVVGAEVGVARAERVAERKQSGPAGRRPTLRLE